MELVVGDRIYREYSGKPTGIFTIFRVTETMAFVHIDNNSNEGKGYEIKFKRGYNKDGDPIHLVGASIWSQESYYKSFLEKEIEIRLIWTKNKLVKTLKEFDYSQLGIAKLDQINKILTNE